MDDDLITRQLIADAQKWREHETQSGWDRFVKGHIDNAIASLRVEIRKYVEKRLDQVCEVLGGEVGRWDQALKKEILAEIRAELATKVETFDYSADVLKLPSRPGIVRKQNAS